MKYLLVIAAMLGLMAQAEAATYYVSTTGNDSTGTGSLANPWATIHHASTVVSPGDTVLVLPGTYNGDNDIATSGTSGNMITYQSQTKWGAKLVGTGTGDGSVVVGLEGGYNRIMDFDITGTDANGIILATGSTVGATASFNQAIGNYVHDMSNLSCTSNSGSGVNSGGGSNYLSVTHNDIIDNYVINISAGGGCTSGPYPTGVYLQTPNDRAIGNVIINSGYGFQTWHNANHNTIFGNTILNNNKGGLIVGEGDDPCTPSCTWNQTGTLVQNNIVGPSNANGTIEEGTASANSYIDNLIYNNTGACNPSNCTTSPATNTGNITGQDPLYVNNTGTAAGNYTLQKTSPARGTGLVLSGVLTDLVGTPYPASGATDIGAYIYTGYKPHHPVVR